MAVHSKSIGCARGTQRARRLLAVGAFAPENAAQRAARRVGSLGRAGTDGHDSRTPTDALRLLWLPAGILYSEVARSGRSGAGGARAEAAGKRRLQNRGGSGARLRSRRVRSAETDVSGSEHP